MMWWENKGKEFLTMEGVGRAEAIGNVVLISNT